jgi:ribosomal protein S18 acetylase RimI-like enzyme
VKIRLVEPNDADGIERLVRESFDGPWSPYLPIMQRGRTSVLHFVISHQALDPDRMLYVGINEQGRHLGIADVRASSSGWFLSYVCVAKEFRGQRVAQQLINKAIIDHDSTRVLELDCFANNRAALALYSRMGFRPIGQRDWFVRALPRAAVELDFIPDQHLAQSAFAAYGLAEFTIVHRSMSHKLGLLGSVVNCFERTDFCDEGLLASIRRRWPHINEALYIEPLDAQPRTEAPWDSQRIGTSVRLCLSP